MRDKHNRIFEAARALFEERGYDAVTTQEISERADIAVGSLFRYAATKNELLLLVYNEKLRRALESGGERSRHCTDSVEAVTALVLPMVELAFETSAKNGRAYQRELLFGTPGETHRQEGLAMIAELQEAIATRLMQQALHDGLADEAETARLAGVSIFAVAHLVISRSSTGAHADHDPLDDLRNQIRQIVHGYFAALSPSGPAHDAGGNAGGHDSNCGDQK